MKVYRASYWNDYKIIEEEYDRETECFFIGKRGRTAKRGRGIFLSTNKKEVQEWVLRQKDLAIKACKEEIERYSRYIQEAQNKLLKLIEAYEVYKKEIEEITE